MFIVEYTWRHRYDFNAIIECEHCGNQQTLMHGYDDHNYHHNVVPRLYCVHCGQDSHGITPPHAEFGEPKQRLTKDGNQVKIALEAAACLADELNYLGPDFALLAHQIRDLKRKYA